MRSTLKLLTFVAGIFSLVALMAATQDIGLQPTFGLVVESYDTFARLALGWLKQPIDAVIAAINSVTHLNISVGEHWRHAAILMNVYFVRDALGAYRAQLLGTFLVEAFLGVAIALVFGISVGTLPLIAGDFWNSFLVVALPVCGVTLYDLCTRAWRATWHREETITWLSYFVEPLPYITVQGIAGIMIAALGPHISAVQGLRSPGFFLLVAFILIVALRWSARAVDIVASSKSHDVPWLDQYRSTSAAKLAFEILGTLLGAAVFFATNAGARYFGL